MLRTPALEVLGYFRECPYGTIRCAVRRHGETDQPAVVRERFMAAKQSAGAGTGAMVVAILW